ncbi:hypothetical protein GCM10009618_11670 [Nesterenkonia lacusekhoensis]
MTVALGAGIFTWQTSDGTGAAEHTVGSEDWISSAPEVTSAEEALTENYTEELWSHSLDPEDQAPWLEAGVLLADSEDDDLVLLDTETGQEKARVPLEGTAEYTVEFLAEGVPAAGVYTGEQFVAITAEGEGQTWELEDGQQPSSMGTTPMVTSEEGETSALLFGEEEPVEAEGNPYYY